MDFAISEMQQMIVDSARRFVEAETGLEQWRDRRGLDDGVDPGLWANIVELGWLALALPEDVGGLGGSMEDVALLMIEIGKGLVTEPVVSTGVLAAHMLGECMTGEDRDDWLGRIATGEARFALAHLEGEAHTGEQPVPKLRASRTETGFVLTGAKFMAFDAPSADWLLATAMLDDDGEQGLFLVDASAEGIAVNSYPLIDGSRASDLVFDSVTLPRAALLAAGDEADSVVAAALDRARLALMAQAVGAMEAALRVTRQYAGERCQFGQPIGKFQAIQHIAADMFVAAFQARSALYSALGALDANAATRHQAISAAKLVCGMAGQVVSRNGVQVHGGYGVTDEYTISHYYRRLLVLEKQYGSIDALGGELAALEAGE